MMKWIGQRIQEEPAMFEAIVRGAIGLGVAFGAHFTDVQITALMGFVGLVLAFFVRSQVTPNVKLNGTSAPEAPPAPPG